MSPQETREERLAAIAARLKAATPGPWTERREAVEIKHGKAIYESSIIAPAQNIAYRISRAEATRLQQDRHSPAHSFDADFIANAPADLAWLLSELTAIQEDAKRLRERLDAVREGNVWQSPVMGGFRATGVDARFNTLDEALDAYVSRLSAERTA